MTTNVYTMARFRNQNPTVYRASFTALDFLFRIGTPYHRPDSCKDPFFPEVYDRQGS